MVCGHSKTPPRAPAIDPDPDYERLLLTSKATSSGTGLDRAIPIAKCNLAQP